MWIDIANLRGPRGRDGIDGSEGPPGPVNIGLRQEDPITYDQQGGFTFNLIDGSEQTVNLPIASAQSAGLLGAGGRVPRTEPRNINSLVTSGPKIADGSIVIVRCGSLVTISAWNARFETQQGSSSLMVLPAGFRPLVQVRTDWSSSKGYFAVFASGSLWGFRPSSAESVVLTYPTADPWPSTLPGTPA